MCVSLKMCKKQHAIFKNNHFLIAFASHPQRRNSLSILTLHLLFFEFYSFLKNFFKNKVMLILYSAGKIDTVVLSSKTHTSKLRCRKLFSIYLYMCALPDIFVLSNFLSFLSVFFFFINAGYQDFFSSCQIFISQKHVNFAGDRRSISGIL